MAYSPLYNTHVEIDTFRGLNQSGDGHNLSMRYATEMENVNVDGGTFQPMREGIEAEPPLDSPIGTLACVNCRFGPNAGKTVLMAISDGHVHTKILGYPGGWVTHSYPVLSNDDCDWLTYETSVYPEFSEQKVYRVGDRVMHEDEPDDWKPYYCILSSSEPGEWQPSQWYPVQPDPTDMLIFSNAQDGMFCLYADMITLSAIDTPRKFGVIARFNERIWGCGIEGDPDMLIYSAPFNPFDWEARTEIPEDGAGDILQPTWDGDSFQSLRQYGSDLLAVKRNSVWRIYGTNPGEFVMQRQYGGGTIVENTLSVLNDAVYMLGENGMIRYNGSGGFPFLQEEIKDLMASVNRDKIGKACAGIRDQTYCLALPINGSECCNALLEYNTGTGALALRTGLSVDGFLQINERLFYTSATYPGKVFELRDDVGKPLPVKWISGYQDLGLKSSIKSAFTLYAMIEAETPVELYIGLRTEKKLKEKIYRVKPGKLARMHLNNHGRIFRLEIRCFSAVPFIIAGGIKLDLELDPD